MAEARVTQSITTGVGTLSFPRLFESTKGKNDKQEDTYDVQIIIPKSQKADLQALVAALKVVGEAKWGDKWRKVKIPLRDGDKEKDNFAEDGQTNGEKYPERLGCYFINARSKVPVGVYARDRSLITNPGLIYGGCKGKLAITFYPYNTAGSVGIGAALDGVQFVADGTPFAGGKPAVESMFDILEDEGDDGLGEDMFEEPEAAPVAKKAAPAKKAAAKKAAPKPAPVEEEPDDLDVLGDEEAGDEDDLFEDLDV